MDSFIRSASEGPPKRALRASGLIGRLGGADVAFESVVGESSEGWEAVAEVEVFSIDHLKRSFSFGSMIMVCDISGRRLEPKFSQRQLSAMSGRKSGRYNGSGYCEVSPSQFRQRTKRRMRIL